MRRIVLIALALLAVAPSGVRAATWYRGVDGALRDDCCCPAGAGYHQRSLPERAVRAACCCTIVERAARDGAVRGAPPAAVTAPDVVPVVTPALPPAPAEVVGLDRPVARGPPPLSDLFVRHSALLL